MNGLAQSSSPAPRKSFNVMEAENGFVINAQGLQYKTLIASTKEEAIKLIADLF